MLSAVVNALAAREPALRFKIVTRKDDAQRFSGCPNVVAVTGISDDQLLQAYQSADLLVLPLEDCTANCALLEGLACGLPVVTTDVGGIRDYVDPSCAVVVHPKDVDGMCDAIVALSHDEPLRRQMSASSRSRALRYDWKHVGSSFMELYQKLIA
jgi:glycosyltransferase involved in cell wall biosynthesis